MTPKEIVLRGHQLFAEGDVEGLSKINHENALFNVNGDHKRSGEYKGFDDFRDNFLAHLPNDFPNFILEIIHSVAEGDRVHVFVKYRADNLDAHGVHIFLVEDRLQKEFTIFDDSQKTSGCTWELNKVVSFLGWAGRNCTGKLIEDHIYSTGAGGFLLNTYG